MAAIATKNRYKLMSNPNPFSRVTCSAFGCDMRSGTNNFSEIRMFTFPRNLLRRRRWELATRRANWKSNTKSRICSKHFITGQPSKDPKHPDYVPSIFVFNKKAQDLKSLSRNMKSKTRRKMQAAGGSCGHSAGHYVASHEITSSCGIKGFCRKCFSPESVTSVFNQSLEPINQTLGQLVGKLKDMEEEREQLRNELALCREEIYHLHSDQQESMVHPQSSSTQSKPNISFSAPSTATVDVDEILQSMYSDEPDDAGEEYDPELLPSQYLEQIYHQPDETRKGKRQKKQSKEKCSGKVMGILDQCESPKKKRMKSLIRESKGMIEAPKDKKSSDNGSPITVIYLKR